MSEEAFLALLENKKQELSQKAANFIDGLLDCKHRWLPSYTAAARHRGNNTTN